MIRIRKEALTLCKWFKKKKFGKRLLNKKYRQKYKQQITKEMNEL